MIETVNNISQYQVSGYTESHCADIVFQNNGINSYVLINGAYVIAPGQSITFACNYGEIDMTKYNFVFNPSGANPVNSLTVVQRRYVGDTSLKKKVVFDFIATQQSGYIESDCGDIYFQNNSAFAAPIIINGSFYLYGFQTFNFRTSFNEIDKTKYNYILPFTASNALLNGLSIIRKKYA